VSYSMVQVDDLPGEGPGGAVRFVRRHLGAEAFGINWFEFAPNAVGYEHDEQDSQRRGTVMRFDPETTRVPVAGPEGMAMIAVGARKGSYEPRGNF